MLSREFDIPHVSTGALLREESARGTALGREADSWTCRGFLVPDELAIRVIRNWISGHGKSFIFDGFPRSVAQAVALDSILLELDAPLDLIIHLELSDNEISRRVAARISCLSCGGTFSGLQDHLAAGDPCPRCGTLLVRRNDDNEQTLRQRLSVYRDLTAPVVEYYAKANPALLHRLDAGMASGEIFERLAGLVRQE
jgi:adenylate kinase